MKQNTYGYFFKTVQKIARLMIPKYRFERPPNQNNPIVYVAHHQNMIGPVSMLAWLKYYVRTWVLSEFTDQEAAYNHYINYTFTKRYGWPKSLSKLIAWPASYIVQGITRSGRMIPVYRGSRKIVETMQMTHDALIRGEDILIFPDVDYSNESKETSNIYEGFLHLEKKYFKETGKHLTFVPIFSEQSNQTVKIGNIIHFSGKDIFIKERKVVANQIRTELNRIATEESEKYS